MAVALAANAEKIEKQINESKSPDCAEHNLAELKKLYAVKALRSPELDRLRAKYEQLAGH